MTRSEIAEINHYNLTVRDPLRGKNQKGTIPFSEMKSLFFGFSIGSQVEAEHVLNRLWIGKAQRTDSGNYSCTIPEHSP